MPSNAVHRRFAKKVLGIDDHASAIIDAPVKQLGPGHRKIGHTIPSAAKMLAAKGELNAEQLKAAALHIALDKTISRMPKNQKKMIEMLYGRK